MQECLQSIKKKPWFLNSECSRHMTRDKGCLISLQDKDGRSVTFGNNENSKIKCIRTNGKNGSALIKDVQFVEGLKHNLLSISQLCNNGYEVTFKQNMCVVKQLVPDKYYLDNLPKAGQVRSQSSCL